MSVQAGQLLLSPQALEQRGQENRSTGFSRRAPLCAAAAAHRRCVSLLQRGKSESSSSSSVGLNGHLADVCPPLTQGGGGTPSSFLSRHGTRAPLVDNDWAC